MGRRNPTEGTFRVEHASGGEETGLTYADAVWHVTLHYPGCYMEHDGDISEGGDRTLVWRTEGDSTNDDGRRAVASIHREESRHGR